MAGAWQVSGVKWQVSGVSSVIMAVGPLFSRALEHLHHRGRVLPQRFQLIIGPPFRRKNMDQDILVIEQNPAGVGCTLFMMEVVTGLLKLVQHPILNGV